MRNILVIRFGALGDLCVLGWSLAGLADNQATEPLRITLVTKAEFVPLMSAVRGIDEVIGLDDNTIAGVRRLAAQLRQRPWDVILDAHNTLRSRLLFGLWGRRPDRQLAKDTWARLGFMSFGWRNARLSRRMLDRFYELTAMVNLAETVPVGDPPLSHFRSAVGGTSAPVLGLAPGAQWNTKRWPAGSFAKLLTRFRQHSTAGVRIYLGPREAAWFPASELAQIAATLPEVTIIRLPDLPAVARSLAEVSVLVTNDSGLLHLAETVGTRVLAFFGPTVSEFGYFPLLEGSRVLERDESCRPCSRNGKRPCRRGDLACLSRISPESALAVVQEMLGEANS